ncbi:hypothetical protein ACFFX0_33455 [Citricoccus parietis]|uniref:4Fe-4S ferredoxin-type domain-containing protein n=1 Tax=Citricoccus parietis TaxID=592307 RepID=A0ABV5GA05_9MICC
MTCNHFCPFGLSLNTEFTPRLALMTGQAKTRQRDTGSPSGWTRCPYARRRWTAVRALRRS